MADPVPPQPAGPRMRTWLVPALVVGGILVVLAYPCSERPRDDAVGATASRLHSIGEAMRAFHDAKGRLPPAVVRDKDGKPLFSWRVWLLPYLEQEYLFQQFRRDEPWDSPHNLALAKETPKCYLPWFEARVPPGTTRFQAFVGPGTAFERPGLSWADFPDGLADTILVAEAGDLVPWSKPADLEYRPDGPLPRLGSGLKRPLRRFCRHVRWRPGFVACFADGRTHFVPDEAGEATVRAMVTRNGGEAIDLADLD